MKAADITLEVREMVVVVDKCFMVVMAETNGYEHGVNIKKVDMPGIGVTGTIRSGDWATGRNGLDGPERAQGCAGAGPAAVLPAPAHR